MLGRLDDKVTVILGASDERSMGVATARRCQAEGAGLALAARMVHGGSVITTFSE